MLFIAAQNGHVRILELLLAHGAKTESARTDGATPLWIAAQMGHDHVVRRLLKAGAKVDSNRHVSFDPKQISIFEPLSHLCLFLQNCIECIFNSSRLLLCTRIIRIKHSYSLEKPRILQLRFLQTFLQSTSEKFFYSFSGRCNAFI